MIHNFVTIRDKKIEKDNNLTKKNNNLTRMVEILPEFEERQRLITEDRIPERADFTAIDSRIDGR